jgi:cytochrome P450
VATQPRHLDADLYPSPDLFDGFRFSKLHEQHHGSEPGSGGMRYQLVTTSPDFLAWGYGRHACPARFMAAMVLKTMFVHVVLNYDVRLEDGVRPEDVITGLSNLPNPNVKILIRQRPS